MIKDTVKEKSFIHQEKDHSYEEIISELFEKVKVPLLKGTGKGSKAKKEEQKELLRLIFNPYFNENLTKSSILGSIERTNLAPKAKEVLYAIAILIDITVKVKGKSGIKKIVITNPESIYQHFYYLKFSSNEVLKALYLNSKNELIESRDIAVGNHNTVRITPADVFTSAVKLNVRSVILVHCHPSGNCVPSENDIKFTRRIQEAGKVLGINVIDHVIIGNDFYSFMENEFM